MSFIPSSSFNTQFASLSDNAQAGRSISSNSGSSETQHLLASSFARQGSNLPPGGLPVRGRGGFRGGGRGGFGDRRGRGRGGGGGFATTRTNNFESQVLQSGTQVGGLARRFEQREEPTLIGLNEAVQRSRATNQRSLFAELATPFLVPSNLGEGRSLFNNRPNPPTSMFSQSPFANSIYHISHFVRGPTQSQLPNRNNITSGRNSSFSTSGVNLANINSKFDRPISVSQIRTPPTFGQPQLHPSQFSVFMSGQQTINSHLNPYSHLNTSNKKFGGNTSSNFQNSSVFSVNQPQTQAITAPSGGLFGSKSVAQQNFVPIPENCETKNTQLLQISKNEEEQEVSENEGDSSSFAEDLQELMMDHQLNIPGDLFSNSNFTQNLTQFLSNYNIRAPRSKVLHPVQQEPETKVNNSEDVAPKFEQKHRFMNQFPKESAF